MILDCVKFYLHSLYNIIFQSKYKNEKETVKLKIYIIKRDEKKFELRSLKVSTNTHPQTYGAYSI